jgi:hypothetical protein
MKRAAAVILTALLFSGTLYADKPEHAGKGKKEKHNEHKKHKNKFSSNEKAKVNDYYSTLPPGLAKKLKRTGSLPPGWQRKVSVGQVLPHEYFQYAHPVPDKLYSQLSVGPVGSQVLQIADRIVRIEAGSNMVLDAIRF